MNEFQEKRDCHIKKKRCGPLRQKLYNLFCGYLSNGTVPTVELLEQYKFRPALYLKEIWREDIVKRRLNTLATFKKWARKMSLRETGVLEMKSGKVILPKEKCRKTILQIHSQGQAGGALHLAYHTTRLEFSKKYAIDKHEFGIGKNKLRRILHSCQSPRCRVKRFYLNRYHNNLRKDNTKSVEESCTDTSSTSTHDEDSGEMETSSVSGALASDHETSDRTKSRRYPKSRSLASSASSVPLLDQPEVNNNITLEGQSDIPDGKVHVSQQLMLSGGNMQYSYLPPSASGLRDLHITNNRLLQIPSTPNEHNTSNLPPLTRMIQYANNNYDMHKIPPIPLPHEAGAAELCSQTSSVGVVDLCSSSASSAASIGRASPDFYDHVGCDDQLIRTQIDSDVTLSAPSSDISPDQKSISDLHTTSPSADKISAVTKPVLKKATRRKARKKPNNVVEQQVIDIMSRNYHYDTSIPIEIKPLSQSVAEVKTRTVRSKDGVTGRIDTIKVLPVNIVNASAKKNCTKQNTNNKTNRKRNQDSLNSKEDATKVKKFKFKATDDMKKLTKGKKPTKEVLSRPQRQLKKKPAPTPTDPKNGTCDSQQKNPFSLEELRSQQQIQIIHVPASDGGTCTQVTTREGQHLFGMKQMKLKAMPSDKVQVILHEPLTSTQNHPRVVHLPTQPLSSIPLSTNVQIVRPAMSKAEQWVMRNSTAGQVYVTTSAACTPPTSVSWLGTTPISTVGPTSGLATRKQILITGSTRASSHIPQLHSGKRVLLVPPKRSKQTHVKAILKQVSNPGKTKSGVRQTPVGDLNSSKDSGPSYENSSQQEKVNQKVDETTMNEKDTTATVDRVDVDLEKEFGEKSAEVCRLYSEQIIPKIKELKHDMRLLSAHPSNPYAHVLKVQHKISILANIIAMAKLNVEEVGVRLKQKEMEMAEVCGLSSRSAWIRQRLLGLASSSSLSDVDND